MYEQRFSNYKANSIYHHLKVIGQILGVAKRRDNDLQIDSDIMEFVDHSLSKNTRTFEGIEKYQDMMELALSAYDKDTRLLFFERNYIPKILDEMKVTLSKVPGDNFEALLCKDRKDENLWQKIVNIENGQAAKSYTELRFLRQFIKQWLTDDQMKALDGTLKPGSSLVNLNTGKATAVPEKAV